MSAGAKPAHDRDVTTGSPPPCGEPLLLNPHRLTRRYRDDRSTEVMRKTVEFFETRGKTALKRDEHDRVWPTDFLDSSCAVSGSSRRC